MFFSQKRLAYCIISLWMLPFGQSNAKVSAIKHIQKEKIVFHLDSQKKKQPSRSFALGKKEVTTEQYEQCVRAGVCTKPNTKQYCNYGKVGRWNHPVNCVSWKQAQRYCTWRGGRLPTIQEWLYAAQGPKKRRYPWGNKPPSCKQVVYLGKDKKAGCNHDRTWPVGSLPAGRSPEGLYDLSGNVAEWTSTCASQHSPRPHATPKGQKESACYRYYTKGGSWHSEAAFLSNQLQSSHTTQTQSPMLGFRCAWDVSPPPTQRERPTNSFGLEQLQRQQLSRKYALLIGIGKYKSKHIPSLKGPVHDIQKVQRLLVQYYGFSNKHIQLLTDAKATRTAIMKALNHLVQQAQPKDIVVFYYSGLGTRIRLPYSKQKGKLSSVNAWLPYDANTHSSSLLSAIDIAKWRQRLRSQKLTLWFDSCNTFSKDSNHVPLHGLPDTRHKCWKHNSMSHNIYSRKTQKKKFAKSLMKKTQKNSKQPHIEQLIFGRVLTIPFDNFHKQPLSNQATSKQTVRHTNPLKRKKWTVSKKRFILLLPSSKASVAHDMYAPVFGVHTHAFLHTVRYSNRSESVATLVKRANRQLQTGWGQQLEVHGATSASLFFLPKVSLPSLSEPIIHRCNAKGFCARFLLIKKGSKLSRTFQKGDEIQFFFRLNRPGAILLLNIPPKGKVTILFPHTYYALLERKIHIYDVPKERWLELPPRKNNSPAFFQIDGKPCTEEVILLASPDVREIKTLGKRIQHIFRSKKKHKRQIFRKLINAQLSPKTLKLRLQYHIIP